MQISEPNNEQDESGMPMTIDASEPNANANMFVLNNEEIDINITEVVIEETLVEKQMRQIKELKEQLEAQDKELNWTKERAEKAEKKLKKSKQYLVKTR